MNKNRIFDLAFLASVLSISIFFRIKANPDFAIEHFFMGDSINRALSSFENFTHGYVWDTGGTWLPLPFWLNTIPLFINPEPISMVYFQFILFILLVIFYYLLIKKSINLEIAIFSTLLLALNSESIKLTSSILSENYYALFIILGLYFYSRFKDTESNPSLFLASLSFASGALCRYEGLVIYLSFIGYTLYFDKKLTPLTVPFLLYMIGSFFYEYPRYNESGIPLYGLLSNSGESMNANITLGLGTELKRLIHIFKLWNSLTLFLIIPAIFGTFTYLIKKKLPPVLNLVFITSFMMIFITNIRGSTAVFGRYWFLVSILSLPIGLMFLKNFFKKFLPSLSRRIFLLSASFITISYFIFFTQHLLKSKRVSLYRVANYIIQNDMHKSKIFHDDKQRAYRFDAFYFYYYLNTNKFNRCCNIPDDFYEYNQSANADEVIKQLVKLDKENSFDYFVIFKNSKLYRALESYDFHLLNKALVEIKNFNESIFIYKLEDMSN